MFLVIRARKYVFRDAGLGFFERQILAAFQYEAAKKYRRVFLEGRKASQLAV